MVSEYRVKVLFDLPREIRCVVDAYVLQRLMLLIRRGKPVRFDDIKIVGFPGEVVANLVFSLDEGMREGLRRILSDSCLSFEYGDILRGRRRGMDLASVVDEADELYVRILGSEPLRSLFCFVKCEGGKENVLAFFELIDLFVHAVSLEAFKYNLDVVDSLVEVLGGQGSQGGREGELISG
jgi:hypothetical protein